jgi:hypothetical protein
VVIPATETSGAFTYSFHTSDYTQLDLWGKVNNGAWQYCCVIPANGSISDTIAVGSTYGFRFYPHGIYPQGGTVNLLGALSVSGTAAAAPTFNINPTHVIVPVGQTTGNFSYNWNAPGYSSLDLWGKVNSGAWQFCCTIPASGSASDSIAVGSTYGFRFYPHGSTSQIIGSLSVNASH